MNETRIGMGILLDAVMVLIDFIYIYGFDIAPLN
jgi:hypothetical protein